MNVRLISYTKPVIDEIETISDLICFCARVSNPANQLNTKTTKKLISYLLEHRHFSPFEMANVCLEITTTRDIARQILRHRSFTFQEFSQRYSTVGGDFILREARMQDTKNRQSSLPCTNKKLAKEWEAMQLAVIQKAKEAYDWAIQNGIAKEQARVVLPEGLTISKLYVNGTIRSWIHYLQTRIGNGTQKEHSEVAVACAKAIAEIFQIEETMNASQN